MTPLTWDIVVEAPDIDELETTTPEVAAGDSPGTEMPAAGAGWRAALPTIAVAPSAACNVNAKPMLPKTMKKPTARGRANSNNLEAVLINYPVDRPRSCR